MYEHFGDGSKPMIAMFGRENHPLTSYFRVPRVPGFWLITFDGKVMESLMFRVEKPLDSCTFALGTSINDQRYQSQVSGTFRRDLLTWFSPTGSSCT